jgi:hypothetical protein
MSRIVSVLVALIMCLLAFGELSGRIVRARADERMRKTINKK